MSKKHLPKNVKTIFCGDCEKGWVRKAAFNDHFDDLSDCFSWLLEAPNSQKISGGVAPYPLPGALPLDPADGCAPRPLLQLTRRRKAPPRSQIDKRSDASRHLPQKPYQI